MENKAKEKEVWWGEETRKGMENFKLQHRSVFEPIVEAMLQIKLAAALTYQQLHVDPPGLYSAMEAACRQLLADPDRMTFFPVEALQGGAGTTLHMNVNEVLAGKTEAIWTARGESIRAVSPYGDMNRGQSTNDVFPTAVHVAAIKGIRLLSDHCSRLQEALQEKEQAFSRVKKLGRTQWMDALPITLGEEFGAFAQAVGRDRWRLYKMEERLRQVNLGGTAVGTSVQAERAFRFGVLEHLRTITGIGLATAEYPMDPTQNQDVLVEASGLLKALAVNLFKIANDLRKMNSGPAGGLGEIRLKALQKGSTIMPGKVNPVLPEMVMQVSMRVMANDQGIGMAASQGEFELNPFLPFLADALEESLHLLNHALPLFTEKCIHPLEACPEQCLSLLDKSNARAMGYAEQLGYERVAQIMEQFPQGGEALMEALENEEKRSR